MRKFELTLCRKCFVLKLGPVRSLKPSIFYCDKLVIQIISEAAIVNAEIANNNLLSHKRRQNITSLPSSYLVL
jgi:hypothetical protein